MNQYKENWASPCTLSIKPSLSLNDMLDGLVLNLPLHLKSNSILCPCALATSGASEVAPCTALTGIGEGEGHQLEQKDQGWAATALWLAWLVTCTGCCRLQGDTTLLTLLAMLLCPHPRPSVHGAGQEPTATPPSLPGCELPGPACMCCTRPEK